MASEFSRDNVMMRIDGDVLDVLLPQSTHRIPLAKLQVRLERAGKSAYSIAVGQSTVVGKDGQPLPVGALYSWGDLWTVGGAKLNIARDAEPEYRAFFAEIAPLCDGRDVVAPPAEPERRGLFGRHAK